MFLITLKAALFNLVNISQNHMDFLMLSKISVQVIESYFAILDRFTKDSPKCSIETRTRLAAANANKLYDALMLIPDYERNLLIKNGYRQSVHIQKSRVTRSSVESEKIRQKHLAYGDIVSTKRHFYFIFIILYSGKPRTKLD